MSRITAYFVGGPADGMTEQFEDLPPDQMQALSEEQCSHDNFEPPTLYSRNDLTGGTVIYVPCGSLLHDAFVHVLRTYVETKKAQREKKESGHALSSRAKA